MPHFSRPASPGWLKAKLVMPGCPADRLDVWHQYTVQLTADAHIDRDQLSKYLAAEGIDSAACYPKLVNHLSVFYMTTRRRYGTRRPGALRAAAEILSLPVHQR
jgi:dTDP-4-amino-4,6-dideoxygalactose transaminase